MKKLHFYIKKIIRVLLNNFVKFFLIIKTSLFRLSKNKRENTPRVVILADYLSADFLFESKELLKCEVGFILTKRYPFFKFLFNQQWRRLRFLHFVPDFGEENNDDLLAYCKKLQIDNALIQAGDFLVPACNFLNSHLNGKGNSPKAVMCSLDKDYMRNLLNENAISVVEKVTLKQPSDVKRVDFYPCVIKPNIGTASEGVILVKTEEEMSQALSLSQSNRRNTEFTTSYLAEEYIVGRQFDVEGILIDGEVLILCIVEEDYHGYFPYFNINWFFFNAFIPQEIQVRIKTTLQKAFEIAELKHGAYHCELRINANGEVKIIEFSNRMGGGFESSITKVTGNHFADLYVRSILGKPVFVCENNNLFLLEKYFKDEEEFNSWTKYLKEHNISYSAKPWVYRGQIAVLRIYHEDKAVFIDLGRQFNLGYIEWEI